MPSAPPIAPVRATSEVPARIYEPALPDPERPPAPVSHRLPEHKGKLARITDDLGGLSEDLREWVELKVQLVRSEIEAFIDSRVGALRGLAVFGIAAAITALFGLVTLAVGLGALFGGRYWLGFLIVNLILAIGTWIVKREFAPGKMHVERSKATGTLKISHDKTPAQKEAEQKGEPVPEQGELKAKQ